jgi:hypothetical protein
MKIDPVVINGNGTSIWGESKGAYKVTKMTVHDLDEGEPYELRLYGEGTEWYNYTDKQIEKEVNDHFKPIIQEMYPNHTIKCITWSEQGMQPEGGWSFDIIND